MHSGVLVYVLHARLSRSKIVKQRTFYGVLLKILSVSAQATLSPYSTLELELACARLRKWEMRV